MSQLPPYDPLPYASYIPAVKPRPTSVTVIAVIGYVLSGLGILGSLCTIPQYLGVELAPNPMMDAMRKDPVLVDFTVGSLVLGIILCFVLLAASSGMMKLKRSGRTFAIWYAILYLITNAIGLILNLTVIHSRMLQATQSAMTNSTILSPAAMKTSVEAGFYGGLAISVVMLAWPISILYVLTRPHVKSAFEKGMPDRPGSVEPSEGNGS